MTEKNTVANLEAKALDRNPIFTPSVIFTLQTVFGVHSCNLQNGIMRSTLNHYGKNKISQNPDGPCKKELSNKTLFRE